MTLTVRAREETGFLAEAGALLSSSLDYERTLADLCAHYGVPLTAAHDAAADALAALEVVRALGRRFAARVGRLSPAELHTLQRGWHAAQVRGTRTPDNGTEETAAPTWPLRPQLPAAA